MSFGLPDVSRFVCGRDVDNSCFEEQQAVSAATRSSRGQLQLASRCPFNVLDNVHGQKPVNPLRLINITIECGKARNAKKKVTFAAYGSGIVT